MQRLSVAAFRLWSASYRFRELRHCAHSEIISATVIDITFAAYDFGTTTALGAVYGC